MKKYRPRREIWETFVETENGIQKAIVQWAGYVKYKDKTLADYLHHSPNGGKRNSKTGALFKAMGTKAGYPDLILDIAKGGYHGLRLELKKKGGSASEQQLERIAMLNAEGYLAKVVVGFDETKQALIDYMQLFKNDRHQWEGVPDEP